MIRLLAIAAAASAMSAYAQTPELTLTRLDCGNGFNDQRRFSDTFAYTDPKVPFTFSCYVIKHGSDYMVWDTGYLPGSTPSATNKPITDVLAQLNIKPDQVKYVGTNKKTGESVELIGKTAHHMDKEGNPGRFLGYIFKNKGVTYFLSEDGLLRVTKGDEVLLEEKGTWTWNETSESAADSGKKVDSPKRP